MRLPCDHVKKSEAVLPCEKRRQSTSRSAKRDTYVVCQIQVVHATAVRLRRVGRKANGVGRVHTCSQSQARLKSWMALSGAARVSLMY
jgi:hypothetical protein